MDLRHFLFEHRIRQQDLVRAIVRTRASFHHPQMSEIVNKKVKPTALQRKRIIKGLLNLGYQEALVLAIDELRPADGQG